MRVDCLMLMTWYTMRSREELDSSHFINKCCKQCASSRKAQWLPYRDSSKRKTPMFLCLTMAWPMIQFLKKCCPTITSSWYGGGSTRDWPRFTSGSINVLVDAGSWYTPFLPLPLPKSVIYNSPFAIDTYVFHSGREIVFNLAFRMWGCLGTVCMCVGGIFFIYVLYNFLCVLFNFQDVWYVNNVNCVCVYLL